MVFMDTCDGFPASIDIKIIEKDWKCVRMVRDNFAPCKGSVRLTLARGNGSKQESYATIPGKKRFKNFINKSRTLYLYELLIHVSGEGIITEALYDGYKRVHDGISDRFIRDHNVKVEDINSWVLHVDYPGGTVAIFYMSADFIKNRMAGAANEEL